VDDWCTYVPLSLPADIPLPADFPLPNIRVPVVPGWFLFIEWVLFIAPYVLMGMFGNYWLLKSTKRRVKKGYHLSPKYNGLSIWCAVCASIATFGTIFISVANKFPIRCVALFMGLSIAFSSLTFFSIIFVAIKDWIYVQKGN
jgi:hypothetical protein